MSALPADSLPPSPSAKRKMSAEEKRARLAERAVTVRLRMAISQELDDRGITTPTSIGAAIGMPPAEAFRLLRGHQWREGEVVLLETAAARLGVKVPPRTNIDASLRQHHKA